MKHLFTYLLGLLLLASPTLAQTTDPVRQKLDDIFANIDKSRIPTGRLLEAAVPLGPVASFNGVLRDSARADMDAFRHLYATALSARLFGTEDLPTIQTFNQRVHSAPSAPGTPIAVAVQRISYNSLRPDAESAGLMSIQNEQLYEVGFNFFESPYLPEMLFAAAPVRSYSPSASVSLMLSSNLYLTSTPGSSSLIASYLDFDDGQGYRQASFDTPLSTTYSTGGTKRVKVRMVYSGTVDGEAISLRQTHESWFDLTVAAPTNAARYTADLTYSPDKGFEKLFDGTASYPLSGSDYTHHLGATVNVRYGLGHTNIKKPFIVVEGYNTSLIAPSLTGLNNQNNTVELFIREIDRATPYNFNDNLEKAGYDLIYIDFKDGTDDIRRNAKLFEEVLAWVNTEKQKNGSAEQNVVMGESMGGLVARYGLARLVRTGYNPQTRLLILHDSPQRGANNPMGLQALTRQIDFPIAFLPGNNQGGANGIVRTSDLSDKLRQGLRILEAPATKQLSLKNVTGIDYEYDNNTFIDGPYKDMVDFGTATPATFPNIIATSDGSQCGRPQNTPVYQELTRNNRNYLLGSSAVRFHLGVQTEAIVNALPAYGTQNTIAHLRVWFTVRVLWLRVDITLLNRNYTSPANTLPYETLPGGTNNLNDQRDLNPNSASSLNMWGAALADISESTYLYNGGICFVPTYSALNVPSVTPATAYAKYVNGATDNPLPPRNLVNYIAMENGSGTTFNEAHLRFTARNSEWLYNEMQRPFGGSNYVNTAGCTPECTVLTINNPLAPGQRLCAGSSATFSIPGLAPNTPVRWSAAPASNFTVATGSGPTFTATVSNNASGNSTITAVVGECETSVSITIPTGPGEPTGYYTGGSNGSGTLTTYQSFPTTSAGGVDIGMFLNEPYNFTFTSDLPGLYLTNTSGRATHFILKPGQGTTITATATNAPCGLVGRFVFICPRSGYRYTATPNPASEELTVTSTDSATGERLEKAAEFDADLYDTYGKKVKTQHSNHGKAVFNARELPDGLYNLRIGQGKDAYSEHIQVKH